MGGRARRSESQSGRSTPEAPRESKRVEGVVKRVSVKKNNSGVYKLGKDPRRRTSRRD